MYSEKAFIKLCQEVGLEVFRVEYDSLPRNIAISKAYEETDMSLSDITARLTDNDLIKYKKLTKELNKNHRGDSAAFYIRKQYVTK